MTEDSGKARLFRVGLVLAAVLCGSLRAHAQSATATLTGTIFDESGAVVPDAQVTVHNRATGLQRRTTTGRDGSFVLPVLPPGSYSVATLRDGFAPAEVKDLVLSVGDAMAITIRLTLAKVGESVTVVAEPSRISTSPAVSTVLDRKFVENLPLNGRSFQSLISVTPGVVLTKAASADAGQFSVNGQRANANYFMVDGVGANIGVSTSGSGGQAAAGLLPGLTVNGGTNNLVSIDALQEFRITTSSYAPEFGRTPGGQVSLVTRSGTNELHGTLFEYFRDDALDATDWFVKRDRLPKPELRQHIFGGVLGGPLKKDKLFFFLSYEGMYLRLPQAASTDVPSLETRAGAVPAMRPFLNAFPRPNAPGRALGLGTFNASYSDPSDSHAVSLRADYTLGKLGNAFARYNDARSSLDARGGRGTAFSLNTVARSEFRTQTLTAGWTWSGGGSSVNDLRVNWSRSKGSQFSIQDAVGGAEPLADSTVFPTGASQDDAQYLLQIGFSGGLAQAIGTGVSNLQRQLNVVEMFSIARGHHQLKFGADYRFISPRYSPPSYGMTMFFNSIEQLSVGLVPQLLVFASQAGSLGFHNLSVFAQDTWQATRRLALTYGLRWELNPAPKGREGTEIFVVQGLEAPATATLAPEGTALFRTRYGSIGPRIGVVYRLRDQAGSGTVVRVGSGVFYDLGLGRAATVLNSPFTSANRLAVNVPVPLSPGSAQAPAFTRDPPYAFVTAFDPGIDAPRSYQWSLAVEQSLGRAQSVSVSYVGAAGRRLLRQESFSNPNPRFRSLFVTRSNAASDYHALQVQVERRLHRGLQALVAYTFGESLDSASGDGFQLNTPSQRLDPRNDRGPSDYDVRHSLTTAFSAKLPGTSLHGVLGAVLRNWWMDGMVWARSATPVNVTVTRNIGFGNYAFRPDLLAGVPLYVDDTSAPGGRRINRAAFSIPQEPRQGTLGRNGLRGFGMWQADAGIRRQFSLGRGMWLEAKAELFNLFNKANFADPAGNLTSTTFGVSTQSLGRSLGVGGGSAGFNPLYQVGGPRSVQLSLRLLF